jgi:hypothetical protein
MAQWIEVKVRYEKMTESGKTIKVTDPYLVDALTCTEAEARVVEEITPFVSGDFNVLKVSKTKVSEIFWDESGDKFYKVKVNFITIDEKTAVEKKSASFIIVQASTFAEALANFNNGMKGTMADYEIEAITETKIVEVYKYQAPAETGSTAKEIAEKVAAEKGVQRAVKKFRDAIPEGMKVSMSASLSDGTTLPETVVVDKSIPHEDDD